MAKVLKERQTVVPLEIVREYLIKRIQTEKYLGPHGFTAFAHDLDHFGYSKNNIQEIIAGSESTFIEFIKKQMDLVMEIALNGEAVLKKADEKAYVDNVVEQLEAWFSLGLLSEAELEHYAQDIMKQIIAKWSEVISASSVVHFYARLEKIAKE